MTVKLTLEEHIELVSSVLDVCTKERLRKILDQIDPMIVTRAIAQSCGVDMTPIHLEDVDPKHQWGYKNNKILDKELNILGDNNIIKKNQKG